MTDPDPILCRVASCPENAVDLGLCARHARSERFGALPEPPTLFDEAPK